LGQKNEEVGVVLAPGHFGATLKIGTLAEPKFLKIFSNFFIIIDYPLQKIRNFSSNIFQVIVDKPSKNEVFLGRIKTFLAIISEIIAQKF